MRSCSTALESQSVLDQTGAVTTIAEPLHYVIQIDRPAEALTLDRARALLEPLGVSLDPSYSPVAINPKLGRFVVRGVATPDVRSEAERLPGVRFFADAKVSPTKR